MTKFKSMLLLILLSFSMLYGDMLTQNFVFTDSKTSTTYDLYNALDAGYYVLVHSSWTGAYASKMQFPSLNSICSEYGNNQNTLLVLETAIADHDKDGFFEWTQSENGGVDYGVVSFEDGGIHFQNALNSIYSNEVFLIKPNRRFSNIRLSNEIRDTLEQNNVSKTIKPKNIIINIVSTCFVKDTVAISWSLVKDLKPVKVEYTIDGGSSWHLIAEHVDSVETIDWVVPNTLSNQCKFKVTSESNPDEVSESNVFSIANGHIVIKSPRGGENLTQGNSLNISWDSYGDIGTVGIEYSSDNGVSWKSIIKNHSGGGSYKWNLPAIVGTAVKVRVYSDNFADIADTSNNFSVSNPITVTAPNGPDTLYKSENELIRWTSKYNLGTVKLEYTRDGGNNWKPIAVKVPDTGSFSWRVPEVSSDSCKVRVVSNDNATIYNDNISYFAMRKGSLAFTSPVGGEAWYMGQKQNVTWNSRGEIGTVKIEYSLDNGASWHLIESATENDGTFDWTLPDTTSMTCKVKITSNYHGTVTATSKSSFKILRPSITLTTPNVGEVWQGYDNREVKWSSVGLAGNITLSYSIGDSASWVVDNTTIPNDGVFNWRVPNLGSENCWIKLSSTNYPSVSDKNDVPFIIEKSSLNLVDITAHPISDTVLVKDTVKLSVTAVGEAPLTYQWQKDSVDIAGQNSSALFLYNVEKSDDATYRCIVSNNISADTSNSAKVTVLNESITVVFPNGAEELEPSVENTIRWSSHLQGFRVSLAYSIDSGDTWNEIVASTEDDGELAWTPPNQPSKTCFISIRSVDNSSVFDNSDAPFTIKAKEGIISLGSIISGVNSLLVYPNPVTPEFNTLNINSPPNLNGEGTLLIYDLLGNLLDSQVVDLDMHNSFQWDLCNRFHERVSSGTYSVVLLVKSQNGEELLLKTLVGIKR